MRPPPPPMDPVTPDVIILGEDLLAFKMYFSGCFALLFFDFFLTLGDEVDYVWKAKKTPMFYLFLMNRYCPMAFCIITLFAYTSPLWNYEALTSRTSCNRFAIVEWLQTLLIVVPAEVVLLLRVYALAARNKYLLGFLISIVVVECVIVFYAMSLPGTNDALTLPHVPIDSFRVCILYSDPKMDTAYLSTSIAFDSIVFAITIAYTVSSTKHQSRPSILDTIRWDGTLYFCVILSGNVVWMALAVNGRPGLKLLNAQPSMYLTSVMINRLTLSVRKVASEAANNATDIGWPSRMSRNHDISAFVAPPTTSSS